MTPDAALAEGFPAADRAAWRALADKALKGGDFDGRLVARTADGIALGPLDTAEDAPSPVPPLWGPRAPGRPWEVRTAVAHLDLAVANHQALEDLQNGAASVLLRLDPAGREGVAVGSADDMRRVLEGVLTDLAPVALEAGWLAPRAAEWLSEAAGRGPAAPLAFHMDPLGTFAREGASPGPLDAHLAAAAETAGRLADTHPAGTSWLANGRAVHEAGGSEAQELGVMAAAALAYVRAGEAAGLPRGAALRTVVLGVSVDGRFLLSTAKLRAARELWRRIAAAFGGGEAPARIEARSSARMLSRLDGWTNLVRLTAAGFAGAVGGADAVVLASFTEPLGAPTAFARRQARNTQLVLQEEAHLGRVADPAAGAWSLERITDALARRAWAVMQEIERRGGLAEALRSGWLQAEVAGARQALERDVAMRKAGLVGVSEFPSLAETPVEVEATTPAPRAAPDPRLPGPDDRGDALAPMRLSAAFERLRARASASPRRPRAYLAELGPVSEHAVRAGFARNLLAAGGIVAEGGPPDAYDPDEGAVAVLVGSDELYASGGAAAVRTLRERGAASVWIAGPELEGTDGRLAAGCDAPAVLDRLLTELGA